MAPLPGVTPGGTMVSTSKLKAEVSENNNQNCNNQNNINSNNNNNSNNISNNNNNNNNNKNNKNNNSNNNKNTEPENKLSNSHQMQQSLHNQSNPGTSNGSVNQIIKKLSPSSNNSNIKPPPIKIIQTENQNTNKNLSSGSSNNSNINNSSINNNNNNNDNNSNCTTSNGTTVITAKGNNNDHSNAAKSQNDNSKLVNNSREFNKIADKNFHSIDKKIDINKIENNNNNVQNKLNDTKTISNCYNNSNIINNNKNNNNNNNKNSNNNVTSSNNYSDSNNKNISISNDNSNKKKIDSNRDSVSNHNSKTGTNRNDSNNNKKIDSNNDVNNKNNSASINSDNTNNKKNIKNMNNSNSNHNNFNKTDIQKESNDKLNFNYFKSNNDHKKNSTSTSNSPTTTIDKANNKINNNKNSSINNINHNNDGNNKSNTNYNNNLNNISNNNVNNVSNDSKNEEKPVTKMPKGNNIASTTVHDNGKNLSLSANPNDIRINISRQYSNIVQANNNFNINSNKNVHDKNKNNSINSDNTDNRINSSNTIINNTNKIDSLKNSKNPINLHESKKVEESVLNKSLEDNNNNDNNPSNNLSDKNNDSVINDSKNNIKILDSKRNKASNINNASSSVVKDDDIENAENRKILLKDLNEHIICNLCQGYLIDATTIVECLHSFCHSCLMKHLRTEEYCPRCEMMINTAKPNIKSDTKLQAIVYKLVPDLYDKELKRKRAFYCDRPEEAKLATPEQRGEDTEHLIFSPSENMSISLEYADIEDLPNDDTYGLKTPKYLQCPAVFTIGHLKKFICLKFGIDTELFCIEIMCKVKAIILCDHYKLMDIAYIYTWKREAPMRFFFRVKESEKYAKILRERRKASIALNIASQTFNRNTSVPKVEIKQEDINDTAKQDSAPYQSKLLNQMIKIKTEPLEPHSVSSSYSNTSHKYALTHSLSTSREFKIVPSPTSPNDSKTDKLKITLVDKNRILSPNSEKIVEKCSSSNHQQKKVSKSSGHSPSVEREERKQENIKMKIDISKQDSIKIINMSGPDSNVVPKEIVKPVKAEWKIKIKKEILSPKTSPTDKKNNKALSPLTVPPITIKAEKLSPRYLSPKTHEDESRQKEETKEIIEEIKKSEFLNSFALQPIKNISPEKQQQQLIIADNLNTDKFKEQKIITNNKLFSLMGPPPIKTSASKRKPKEPLKTIAKKSKMSTNSLASEMIKNKLKKSEPNVSQEMISFKLAPFPIGGICERRQSADTIAKKIVDKSETNKQSVLTNAILKQETKNNQKQSEDIRLMPAPPPLAALDALKKTSPKPVKSKLSMGKKNYLIAPPGSQTPRPGMVPAGIASLACSKNGSTGLISAPGNRTPIAGKRYPPILPKELRPNPFANIPSDVNKMLKNSGTEIRTVPEINQVKVYGPAPKSKTPKQSMPSPNQNTGKNPQQNYLNYALFNASKQRHGEQTAPPGCRTPMYTPNSPIYSPSSPQYMSTYNIPIQPTYKYTPQSVPQKSNTGTNYLQNVFGSQSSQLASLFPAPPVKADDCKGNSTSSNNLIDDKKSKEAIKRPFPYSQSNSPPINNDNKITSDEPVEKQMKVKTLLNSCNINIPSSLSITITSDEGESRANNLLSSKHKSPVNNYIEILKLPPEEQNETSANNSASDKLQKTPVKTINTSCSPPVLSTKTVSTVSAPRSSPLPLQTVPSQTKISKPSPKQSIQTKVTSSNKSPNENSKKQEINNTVSLTPPPSQTTKNSKSVNNKSPSIKKISSSPEKQKLHNSDKLKSDKKEDSKKSPPKNNENLVGQSFMKKFRHILPRTSSPPQQQNPPQPGAKCGKNITASSSNNNVSPTKNKHANSQISNFGIVRPGNLLSQTEKPKTDIKSSANGDNIKLPQQSPPLPINGQITSSVSPQTSQASEVANFLNERMIRQQAAVAAAAVAAANQQSNTTHNMLFPHLTQFGHQFPTINYGYNFQQAFMFEQISRMQKEAIEKYKLKFSPNSNKTNNNINTANNGTKSGPSSPSNNTNISINNTNNVNFNMQKDATKS